MKFNSISDLLKYVIKSIKVRLKPFFLVYIFTVFLFSILLFLVPNKYTATATLLPTSENDVSQFSSLASIVGIDIGSEGRSMEEYPVIAASNFILDQIVFRKWELEKFSNDSITLMEYYEYTNDELAEFEDSIKALTKVKTKFRESLDVSIDRRTNILTFSLTLKNPYMASTILNEIIVLIDIYNNQYRKTESYLELKFLMTRLDEISQELREAEKKITSFQELNREWQQSPYLTSQYEQLKRIKDTKLSVWRELTSKFEFVRLNVEKEKRTLNVLDFAEIPTEKVGPRKIVLILIFSVLYLFILSFIYAFHGQIKKNITDIFE